MTAKGRRRNQKIVSMDNNGSNQYSKNDISVDQKISIEMPQSEIINDDSKHLHNNTMTDQDGDSETTDLGQGAGIDQTIKLFSEPVHSNQKHELPIEIEHMAEEEPELESKSGQEAEFDHNREEVNELVQNSGFQQNAELEYEEVTQPYLEQDFQRELIQGQNLPLPENDHGLDKQNETQIHHKTDSPVQAGLSDDSTAVPLKTDLKVDTPLANSLPQTTKIGSQMLSLTDAAGHVNLLVFAVKALEDIKEHRVGRKGPLKEALENALEDVKINAVDTLPAVVLKSLCLACQSGTSAVIKIALDCLGKLLNYSFFVQHRPQTPSTTSSLMEEVVNTVCDCFHGANTDEGIQLQIIKALLAAVVNENVSTIIHSRALLKSVRTTYNIFLLSRNSTNQETAQVALGQMSDAVFERLKPFIGDEDDEAVPGSDDEKSLSTLNEHIKVSETSSELRTPASSDTENRQKVTLQSFENRQSLDQVQDDGGPSDYELETSDLLIKDAFLVFRSLCKLSSKPISSGTAADIRLQFTRSKLISLYLVFVILKRHINVFKSPKMRLKIGNDADDVQFADAVKPYLCLTLSRNSTSSTQVIFDISSEIFSQVILHLRRQYKLEIGAFLNEIYLPMLNMRNSSPQQKYSSLGVMEKICSSPKLLVELYLNYDCDRSSVENHYEKTINTLSHLASAQLSPAASENLFDTEPKKLVDLSQASFTLASLTFAWTHEATSYATWEACLKYKALRCLVSALESLILWANLGIRSSTDENDLGKGLQDISTLQQDTLDRPNSVKSDQNLSSSNQSLPITSKINTDDPDEIEALKQRKNALQHGIKLFNMKPMKGIDYLVEKGFLAAKTPECIADLLISTDGLDKTTIGNFLGEGDEENIAIMHQFVNRMNFRAIKFTDALRKFLQNFRLPGEAQKIDRFMLKFAERYVDDNPSAFANADAAYILAYSTIMLNTDQHNRQVRVRMSKEEFLSNNRGINDGADLSQDMLGEIYDEISQNEIVLSDDHDPQIMDSARAQHSIAENITNAFMGKNLQREAFLAISDEMGRKIEDKVHSIRLKDKKSVYQNTAYYFATHAEHVGPMFDIAWISFLAALSHPLQDSDDTDMIKFCLDGFKLAMRISTLFNLQLARDAFLSVLSRYTNLDNPQTMRLKNVYAIDTLLQICISYGNDLCQAWKEFLTRVSQFESLQMAINGLNEASISTVTVMVSPESRTEGTYLRNPQSYQPRSIQKIINVSAADILPEVAEEISSARFTKTIDSIFTRSVYLSGSAIVDFVTALCKVSKEEIATTETAEVPRMYSLQKLVEISYYNMNRIRMEWSNVWQVIGDYFNEVGCNPSSRLAAFALDSLRQLSMKFLEIEELPHFKFQKDFLKPFEYVITNSNVVSVKEMTLQCIQQMIQARSSNIRSGWLTIFNIFSAAARDSHERIVVFAFTIVKSVVEGHAKEFAEHETVADITVCLSDFAKNKKFQQTALQATEMMQRIFDLTMERIDERHAGQSAEEQQGYHDALMKYCYPILFALHDISMNGDDLEVRSRALSITFNGLQTHENKLTSEFWQVVFEQILMPMFSVLRTSHDHTRFSTEDELSIWLSTTFVQAIRGIVALFAVHYDVLSQQLSKLLDSIMLCISQDSDALAKIGATCLQTIIVQLSSKFGPDQWHTVTAALMKLFEETRADEMFDFRVDKRATLDSTILGSDVDQSDEQRLDLEKAGFEMQYEELSEALSPASADLQAARRRQFQPLIVKCVLQLLVIDTVSETLEKEVVFMHIPPIELLKILEMVDSSRKFAREFNADIDLRKHLLAIGFMKQLPNLLQQEIAATSLFISVLCRMFLRDKRDPYMTDAERSLVEQRLLPMCEQVLADYGKLKFETQARNIKNWRPVVENVLQFFLDMDSEDFVIHSKMLFKCVCDLIEGEGFDGTLRSKVSSVLRKIQLPQ